VIVLDLMMPVMDGWEFRRRQRQDPALAAIPIIVISGGDTYQLSPKNITTIGEALLAIPHVRRMRFATKGPAVMPMKILTDTPWVDALTGAFSRIAR